MGPGGVAVAWALTTQCSVPAADPMAAIKRKMLEGDTIAKARQHADLLVKEAIDRLAVLDETPAKQGLVELARLVVDRDR